MKNRASLTKAEKARRKELRAQVRRMYRISTEALVYWSRNFAALHESRSKRPDYTHFFLLN